ncbi:MAG: cupin domain-containing protein, partial [Phycisphaerae bacterium]|nr:cupin domain-containing protein [Phycisphaerae bacterium]
GGSSGSIVSSLGVMRQVPWSAQDLEKDVAVMNWERTAWASYHLVRLRGAEKPHVHDRTDLTVFVLSGRVRMHLSDQVIEAAAGDVVEIPHGETHWAENIAAEASEAYVVFTPPFDGSDKRLVEP